MGPQGPAGADGQVGATGPAGAQGTQGEIGPEGPQGAAGIQGPEGPAGSDGRSAYQLALDDGYEGTFFEWLASLVGPTGASAYEVAWFNGFQGDELDWLESLQGPAGAQGPQGPSGAMGPQGPAGPQGEQGVVGPAGPQGAEGPTGPAGTPGLQGPAGPQGPQGATGPQGVEGPAGPQGPTGADGANGADGAPGLPGPAGADGAAGPAGDQGPQGPQGEPGPQGIAGEPGPAGADGAAGPAGPTGTQGPAGASPFALNGIDAVYTAGNVGIGTAQPAERLSVDGVIESMDGGFRFPDGTIQMTASFGGGGGGGDSVWSLNGANTYYSSGNVGIGTPTPSTKLDVRSTGAAGIYAETASSADFGRAIAGKATALTGQTVGVYGESEAGRGLFGVAWGGWPASPGPTYGVYGESYGIAGIGVYGRAVAGSGLVSGGYFETPSGSGRGIFAAAGNQNATGSAYGGEFESRTTNGRGVWAKATASSGLTYGVYGQTSSPSGYGVWSQGALNVVGNSTVSGTKSFRIDDPKDPENKFLLHYSAEGPEPQNIYNGTVTLDGAGEAWVQLPDYFGSINRDPRYQLTCVGGFAPIYIADEVDAATGRFRIAGGRAGMKVSWEVKAIRNDPYVRAHGAPVAITKQGEERGKYLHPELFGKPREMGIGYQVESSPVPAEAPVR